jgi:hypothetical protein
MYQNNGYNPMMNAQQRLQQLEQQYPQYQQQNNMYPAQMSGSQVGTQMQLPNQQPIGIQGKMVSDFETVKATETPLDGSITYFPLVNGEYIYTKFLNMNTGCSDYAVYKKVSEEQQDEQKEEFDIKAYFDEKFENLKQELKGGAKNGNARKSNSKPDSAEIDG